MVGFFGRAFLLPLASLVQITLPASSFRLVSDRIRRLSRNDGSSDRLGRLKLGRLRGKIDRLFGVGRREILLRFLASVSIPKTRFRSFVAPIFRWRPIFGATFLTSAGTIVSRSRFLPFVGAGSSGLFLLQPGLLFSVPGLVFLPAGVAATTAVTIISL